MISLLGERCPNATLDLLSGRVCLKHYLTNKNTNQRWSARRPAAQALVKLIIENGGDGARAVQAAPARWKAPEPPTPLPSKKEVKLMSLRMGIYEDHPSLPGFAWCTAYNLAWYRWRQRVGRNTEAYYLSECWAFADHLEDDSTVLLTFD
eukprot:1652234-Pyramimonas_sp.AAC.1